MNRNDLARLNGNMLVYLKSFNFKLCRKGLMERCRNMGILVGDVAENEFLKKLACSSDDFEYTSKCLIELNSNKLSKMHAEIVKLKIQINHLSITIRNTKRTVQLSMNEENYTRWLIEINELSKKMKQKYSNECNSLYDHLFRMQKSYANDWTNIAYNIDCITKCLNGCTIGEKETIERENENVEFGEFNDGDLEKLFNELESSEKENVRIVDGSIVENKRKAEIMMRENSYKKKYP